MITMDKRYTTRDGRPVRIYAIGLGGVYSVHGATMQKDTDWNMQNWTSEGYFFENGDSSTSSLIEVWTPLTDELCWFWNDNDNHAVLGKYKGVHRYDGLHMCEGISPTINYKYIAQYIPGELPEHLKDAK